MADFRRLPEGALSRVAGPIGERLRLLLGAEQMETESLTIRESMDEWVLGPDAFEKATEHLAEVSSPTGRWHHQIGVGDSVQAYARTRADSPAPGDWCVVEVTRSVIAQRIEDAIRRIDAGGAEGTAQLLLVPTHDVYAFWLSDVAPERIYPFQVPDEFSSPLPAFRFYDVPEFLGILRKLPAIQGLRKPDPAPPTRPEARR
jgi:hypothetical protein